MLIGYTFYATAYWGKGINRGVKVLMLNHAFKFVSTVYFHIGAQNIRSQMAITRLGAKKVDEQEIAYHGEPSKLNFVYAMDRDAWQELKP
jgi:RimJ/RimL family protein N-acetyltransferase